MPERQIIAKMRNLIIGDSSLYPSRQGYTNGGSNNLYFYQPTIIRVCTYGLEKVGIEQTTPEFIGVRGAYWFTLK